LEGIVDDEDIGEGFYEALVSLMAVNYLDYFLTSMVWLREAHPVPLGVLGAFPRVHCLPLP
jgi:hypothetical protein